MKFNIWDRELEFDLKTKNIKYKNKIFTPTVRTFWDMQNLYLRHNNINNSKKLYFMYRDIYFDVKDKQILKNNSFRYDITIILPILIWDEFNKTYWHYHPKNKIWNQYQELYQVLSWEAIYLQQNEKKVFYTKAISWDSVNMDEWFWHITINNTTDKVLIMANLVDNSFSSLYEEYKIQKWWMYYFLKNTFIKNPNINTVAKIQQSTKKYNIQKSLYDDFLQTPEKFNFLH